MIRRLFVIAILLLPAFSWLLQPGYFTMHDDLQTIRQLEMENCFKDGQIPCRWSENLGYGFGYPLFNFYPPLPYLVGQIYRVVGFPFVDAVKAVGVTGFILTAVFMYLLGEKLWGRRGGLISAFVYTYAPYHSVDFYVRGAMNEFWAMAFYPAVFLSLMLLVTTKRFRYVLLTAVSVACLMLSHNPMLMIFAPIAVVWTLYWMWQQRSWRSLPWLALSGIWAFGLAAFFTLPVLLEQKFAHVETLTIGYFNFLAHYLDFRQIFFNINWGYGESILGPADTMSFALGYVQWIIPVAIMILAIFSKKLRPHIPLLLLLVAFAVGALFFTHSKSTPIWLHLEPLKFLQFPWRFLTVAVFALSVLAGAVAVSFRQLQSKSFLIFVLIVTLLLNANYFRPRAWLSEVRDPDKFSGQSWRLQVTGSIFDYLPIDAPLPPPDPAGSDVGIVSGAGQVDTLEKTSHTQLYALDMSQGGVVEIQTFYFPGWRVYLDNQEMKIDPKRDPLLGRMQVDVPAGRHILRAEFTNTPVRTVANNLSVFSWSALLASAFFQIKKRQGTQNIV